jgi:amino acid adenylation domain-containing protein
VSLPTYPFERQRYLIEKTAGAAAPWTELAVRQREQVMSTDESKTPRVETPQSATDDLPGAELRGVSSPSPARQALVGVIKNIIHDLTGTHTETIDPQAAFLDVGVDSLLMVQAARRIQNQVGVKLTVVQFLEELTTLDKVAEYLEREIAPERLAALVPPTVETPRGASPAVASVAPSLPLDLAGASGGDAPRGVSTVGAVPPSTAAPDSPLQAFFAQQLQIMAQQLQLLQGGAAAQPPAPVAVAPPPQPAAEPKHAPAAPVTYTQFANYHPIDQRPPEELTPQQRAYLDRFIRRYTARTAKSKEMTERFRPSLADGRGTVAFRRMWKEIVYPIHSERSKGAYIWDVDGNEYVDITMGFGLHFFGHSPDFLMEALKRQMERGVEVGPQSPLAGQAAELLCSLTGMDRALFCTSGTEAILGALRVARTVTQRNKVAVLSDSFHGWSDSTMVRRAAGRLGAMPGAPGMSPGTLEDVIVLEYGSEETVQQLETLSHELAAVLVEPVRSRFPDQQPREFLHALRKVTAKTGALLIFDEIVTGFRIHPGGAQAWFGVEADLATYGKMVAGGLPIGVLAGRARFMDALDGGLWRFGDSSYPQAEKTLFTGTYFKHPLSLAAAWAVLDHLRQAGPMLQAGLAVRTAQLASDLNAWFREGSVPIEAVHFGPLFRFRPGKELRHPELFYFHLVDHGVYFTQEAGNCFLTPAHSEEDIYRIQQAVQRSVQELADGGFLPGVRPAPLPPRREVRRPGHGDSGLLALVNLGSVQAETTVSPTDPGYIELPVTDGQRVLWIASKISPMANRSYNEPLALHMRGRLLVPEIREAVRQVSDRHQALRSSFTPDGTRQKIPRTRPVPVPLIDYSGLPEPHRSRERRWCLETLAGGIFNLEHGPLLRAGLLKVGPEEHYLSLTAHHIVIDGGSAGVMMRELSQIYTALCHGEPSPLPPAESLADYVVRVVSRSPNAADQRAAEAYWTQVFERPVSLLELPLDRPRPRTIPWWGHRIQQTLEADLMSGIRRLAHEVRATPYAIILAAWGAVLHEITRHDDLIVGVPSRDPDVTGPMVGYFINLLPVRMLREPGETFRSHLAKVRQSVFDVMEHQNYPLNRLLERIGLAGGLDGFIISTTFNMERIEEPRPMPGLDARYAWFYHDAARIDLHVNLMEDTRTGGGLLDFAYKTTIYDGTSVERWSSAFRSVLREVVGNPDASLRALPLLSPGERQQLLAEWNDTALEGAPDVCLHELFEEQAARRPEAQALALGDQKLSYGDLDRLSSRLAGLLSAQGVGPEVRVGLSLDRGFKAIVALLAILKAGGGYVFLDPGHPRERLLFLLRDCEIPLLITHRRVIDKLGDGLAEIGTRVLDADAGWPDSPDLERPAGVTPDNLAYVLYTSGSTGTPNGVLVTHRAAVNVIRHAGELCRVGPESRTSLTTFLGFDVSVHEIFAALAHGGCLCIIPDAERTNPYLLAERVARYRLTTACFTPSMLAVLPEASLASVTSLSVAGEAFPGDLAEKWSRGRRFLNFYGPTETTIFSTWEIFEDAVLGLKGPTIGRPIRNLQIHIVDPQLKPVPIGMTGEIMIGGVGLARGYVNRPAKTAEKWVPNPFAEGEPGSRLYRTGDLARLRADGRIEFLGRADGQVKLRGFRIELGEVESVIAAYPGVLEAAVAIRGESGSQSLAAYVVWEEGKKNLAGLREKVESRLPDYMVPSAWTELPALPRNANGKVDRLVLRAMQVEQEVRAHVEPETPLECFLVDTWRDVLRVDRVGLHDNFLELGGNSINGAMLAYQIQATLGEELHAVVIFDAPTVAKLARLLAERFPDRVVRIWGEESLPESLRRELLELADLLGDADLEEMALRLDQEDGQRVEEEIEA